MTSSVTSSHCHDHDITEINESMGAATDADEAANVYSCNINFQGGRGVWGDRDTCDKKTGNVRNGTGGKMIKKQGLESSERKRGRDGWKGGRKTKTKKEKNREACVLPLFRCSHRP